MGSGSSRKKAKYFSQGGASPTPHWPSISGWHQIGIRTINLFIASSACPARPLLWPRVKSYTLSLIHPSIHLDARGCTEYTLRTLPLPCSKTQLALACSLIYHRFLFCSFPLLPSALQIAWRALFCAAEAYLI